MQLCRSLYCKKFSACVLKVFIIKLVCRAILTINSISRCDMCQPFLELPPAAFHLSALPYSLSFFSSKISCNSYPASPFSSWLQLRPFPSVLRKSWTADCINQGSAHQRDQKYALPGNLCFGGMEEDKMPVLCLLWGDTQHLGWKLDNERKGRGSQAWEPPSPFV